MVRALLFSLLAAATALAADVSFLPASNAVPITQTYTNDTMLFHYDTIKPAAGAQLYVSSQSATLPIPYPGPGTPFTFVPTRSVWMGYPAPAADAATTRLHFGHVALASDPSLHLTVDLNALSSGTASAGIPYLKPVYVLDDATQAEQFWSFDSVTSILTFLGSPKAVVSPVAVNYGVIKPTTSPELVHVVPASKVTGNFLMNGLLVNECTTTVCTQ